MFRFRGAPLGRFLMLCALAALASLFAGASEATLPPCPALPLPLTLEPGERLHACTRSLEARVDRAEDVAGLDVDLLVRPQAGPLDRVRVGSYVPGLAPRYGLEAAGTRVSEGALRFRLSEAGPAYGVTLDVAGLIAAGTPAEGWVLVVDEALRIPLDLSLVETPDPLAGDELDNDALRVTLLGSLDPRAPDDYNDVWGYHVGDTHIAIVGGENGTSFIDVSDPANPVEVRYIAGPNSSWRDIKTYGTYAYIGTEGVGSGEGMQIVDMSDPLNPTLVRTYTATFTTSHNIYIDVPAGLLYSVGTNNGTRILDVATDPSNPVEVGSWTDRYVHDAYVADSRAFFSEVNNGLQEILDATDPNDLQVLASWPTPGDVTHNVWATQDQTITLTTDETTGGHVIVWDTSDLSGEIPLLSEYEPNPSTIVHNVILDDEDERVATMSHYGIGGHLIDIYRESRPVQLGFYDTYPQGDTGFNGSWGVYPFDPRGYIYLSDIQTGLYVVRYDPTGGTLSGVVRDATSGEALAGASLVNLGDASQGSSGADGVYAFYADAGPVELRASAPGYASRVLRADAMPVGGRVDVDVALTPLPRGPISGSVSSAGDGLPIEGARVSVPELGIETTSAGDGSFSLDVAVGGHVVIAEAFGFAPGRARVLVDPAGVSGIALALDPASFSDDAEINAGWTLGIPSDTNTSGDWVRVDPNGTGGGTIQPEDDNTPFPGVAAFVTGQGSPGQAAEAVDVDGGPTTLVSPTINAAGLGAAQLEYARWVATEGGFFSGGGSLRVELSDDDGASWTTVETVSSHVNRWVTRRVDVGSFVDLTSQLRARFVATPTSPFNFRVLEAAIDDVQLVRACDAAFNVGVLDLDRDGLVDACDACPADALNDADGDGLCADVDNAPAVANADQLDGDGDGVGDAGDNCPSDVNPAQRDLDDDGLGDECDSDADGDGRSGGSETDGDNDGVDDGADLCPLVPDARQLDEDGDGEGNACDRDDALVQGLRFVDGALSWESEADADSYDVQRGLLGSPALVRLSTCFAVGLTTPFVTDAEIPTPGDGFFYLVSRVAGGVAGSAGEGSDGSPRAFDETCR